MTSLQRSAPAVSLLVIASLLFFAGLTHGERAVAAQQTLATLHNAPFTGDATHQDAPVDADADDERVPVQVWTVAAAVLAAAAGLLFFLVRLIMGWVKPPPPQQDSTH